MLARYRQRLTAKSAAVLMSLETRLDRLLIGWLLVAGLAAFARVVLSPAPAALTPADVLPYWLVVIAPFASVVLALRWFADGDRLPQPKFRLALVGRWTDIDRSAAAAHPLYGAGGIMVSLLVGMLLNVPIRAAEYFSAIPAIGGAVPHWFEVLQFLMTLDVVLLTSLYCIAFVAALRRVPMFPRLLVAVWMLDLAMQMFIASAVTSTENLPPQVAAALHALLDGNVKKVLISAALWSPYLLLSRRVNLTYRHRLPA